MVPSSEEYVWDQTWGNMPSAARPISGRTKDGVVREVGTPVGSASWDNLGTATRDSRLRAYKAWWWSDLERSEIWPAPGTDEAYQVSMKYDFTSGNHPRRKQYTVEKIGGEVWSELPDLDLA